jgi:hypothetical protein
MRAATFTEVSAAGPSSCKMATASWMISSRRPTTITVLLKSRAIVPM